jgi:hypothetical protein
VRFVQYATLPTSKPVPAAAQLPTRFGDAITLQCATFSSTTLQPGDVLGVTLVWMTDQPLAQRYKVFVQLLDAQGQLVTQHDGEPGNNLAITTTWQPGQPISDAHGLLIPTNLPAGDYTLIAGLYDPNNPQARLPVNGSNALKLDTIHIQ